jgi:hypothetical protein
MDRDGKGSRLIGGVKSCRFNERSGAPVAEIVHDDGQRETLTIDGDAYLMNDTGKTIDSFRQTGKQP